MPKLLCAILLSYSIALISSATATTWELDTGYMSSPDGVNERVYALGQDSSNRLIAGGLFTTAGGQSSKGLARFFSDGTSDPSFDIGVGVAGGTYNYITDLLVLPDDSIIIVGDFGSFNGTTRGNIARIKTDGSVDIAFAAGAGADAMIRHIEHSGDGGYIIGGNFSNYDGTSRSRLAKLNSDGSLNLTFTFDHNFNQGEWIDQIEVFTDGGILVAGDFAPYDVFKFQANGERDYSFSYSVTDHNYVEATLLCSNGKLLIGGTGGTLYRFNADGTYDENFDPELETYNEIYGLSELDDERIVVTGSFLTPGAIDVWNIVVLNSNGSIDTSAIPDRFKPSDWVGPTVIQNETLIFAGRFSGISENDNSYVSYNRIARFNTNPATNSSGAVYFNKSEVTIIEGADYRSLDISLIRESITEDNVDVQLELVWDNPDLPDPQLDFHNLEHIFGSNLTQSLHANNSTDDDDYYTGTRFATYSITSVSDGYTIGAPSEIRVAVIDDEPHPNIRFASDTIEVTEGQHIEDALEILYNSQPADNADYRIEVDSENKDLKQHIHIFDDSFYLRQEQIHTSDLDINDDDDLLTGPQEVTLRLVPFDPEDAQYLGDNATTTLRILDNEVANSIRFDLSQLTVVSNQDPIEIPVSYDGYLHQTVLRYEVEVDDPAWERVATVYPYDQQTDQITNEPPTLETHDGNDAPLPSTTGRIRILTDQTELLGEPSTLELILHDRRSLDGWKILQYPETHADPNLLTLDSDGDGQNTELEWLNDSDPNDATDRKFLIARTEHVDSEGQSYFSIRFYYSNEKPNYATIVEHKHNLTDIDWTIIWRSDNDPEFHSELVIHQLSENGEWPEVRLPDPAGTSDFVRIRYEKVPTE